jgi:hypothetical protein
MLLRRSVCLRLLSVLVLLGGATGAPAAITPEPSERFGDLVVHDPAAGMPVLAERPGDIPGFEAAAAAWQGFGTEDDGAWSVHVDRRSGAPLLVQGSGIRWLEPGETGSLEQLEAKALEFLGNHEALFRVKTAELVLNREASTRTVGDVWVLVFDRVIGGVPVEGQRFRMYVKFGKLLSFGAERWGQLRRMPAANLNEQDARQALRDYMKLTDADTVNELDDPRLVLLPVASGFEPGVATVGAYTGRVGEGVDYRLAWRFAWSVAGERGMWVAKVDATSGEILAFYDDVKYARVLGGAYPISNDGNCPEGCEQTDLPMPWADVSIDGAPAVMATDTGLFTCSPAGGNAVTNLSSQFVRIADTCGATSESVTCDADLDLGSGPGTDCDVPPGGSFGNTHAGRTNFYHLNRIKEKGRYYLPGNPWLSQQLVSNVNVDADCNASYGGELNFFTSGGGCRNTGEIGGVVHHEYGHGLDDNDGGGFDNSSEAYADVTAIFQERISCVGPGFFESGTCSGYGDTCLSCSGIREHDWDARQTHTPATPANFTDARCGGGSGPCGRAVHCESYVPSESIYDLATRDLPATGLDAASSWQLAERLWYASRAGSGGPIYNCALPEGDSCNAGSWYNQMRMEDDDDGDLSNGTPHAAAIWAAFARHEIACGEPDDPENQSSGSCPNLAAPVLTVEGVNGAVELSWDPVPGAADYLVHRTELGCAYSQNVIATVAAPATSFTDDGVPNGLSLSYRVQARAANSTCESPVSTCETAAGGALSAAGSISLDRSEYACSTTMSLTVRDANVGGASLTATVESNTESTPENVTLFETAVGSGQYSGSIDTITGAAVNGDGLLSVSPGDTITARYIDDDDGAGGSGIERTAAATVECTAPIISNVTPSGIGDRTASVQWITDTAATSIVHYGESTATDLSSGSSALVASHDEQLGGLQPCTVYFFSVESRDAAGNAAGDDNGGSFYSFETLGQFRDGLRQCHLGEVSLDEPVVGCSSGLPIRLVDLDLNLDPLVADTVEVPVTSTTEVAAETVTLTETGPNTSVFVGSIPTGTGAAVPGDGILQAADGDLLTVSYDDADDGSGFPATSIATSDADCDHAGIFDIQVVNVTDESAVVSWKTSEPSTSSLDWGETTALGNTVSSSTLGTDHSFTVSPLPECGRFYFRVSNTDVHGNTISADAGGDPFGSNVFTIGGQFIRDDFSTSSGWTLEGEWEIDEPQGFGTGNGDPNSAYDGTQVLGHDLTGLGNVPGNYENNDESAISPVFDLSALSQAEIKYRRWLNTSFGWTASIEVDNGGGWSEVWSGTSSASSWSLQSVDITSEAAGQSAVQIRFRNRRTIGLQGNAAGWNVDRLIIRDASLPEFETCGLCGGAPAFGGLQQAADLDPCGDSGVQLDWSAAAGWGTGNTGTYAIYRDTDPAFVPGPGNLVASGVAGTTFTDSTAPNDVTLYYVVRAENDETCSSGPNNGGVEDGNLVRVAVRDDTSQAPPSSIGETLLADPVNNAHVRLSWSAAAGAFEYKVTRADAPQGPFGEIGRVGGTFFEDRDELVSAVSRFYRVVAVDACGNEAP